MHITVKNEIAKPMKFSESLVRAMVFEGQLTTPRIQIIEKTGKTHVQILMFCCIYIFRFHQ